MTAARNVEIGERFGSWRVVGAVIRAKWGRRYPCVCECGVERAVAAGNLFHGKSLSCGDCSRLTKPRRYVHGQSRANGKSAEYKTWNSLKARCAIRGEKSDPRYAGRGIRVCQRWQESFEAFYADMGPRPSPKHSIDRIDSTGDYEPGNCRWATAREQANNTRRNRRVTIDGVTKTVAEWARELGVNTRMVYGRLHRGWDDITALTRPIAPRFRGAP